MALVVQKFGGTSVADADRIRAVAARAILRQREGDSVVVVVSAMKGETDRLLALAKSIHPLPPFEESDVAAAAGEQIAASLTAIALRAAGAQSRSFLAHQLPIYTDSTFGDARVSRIDTRHLLSSLQRGQIPVVAGFQGVNAMNKITTLGRGGSDTSAVAIAAALGAECEIFTDVDGVFSADPGVAPDAVKLDHLSYAQMLALATLGAKVLHRRSVSLASRYSVPLSVRSSFHEGAGTRIDALEDTQVRAIACDRDLASVEIEGKELGDVVPSLATGKLLVQRIERSARGVTVFLRRRDLARALALLGGSAKYRIDDSLARVSLVGHGLASDPEMIDSVSRLLTERGISLLSICVDEVSLSAVVRDSDGDTAVRTLHEELITRRNA